MLGYAIEPINVPENGDREVALANALQALVAREEFGSTPVWWTTEQDPEHKRLRNDCGFEWAETDGNQFECRVCFEESALPEGWEVTYG